MIPELELDWRVTGKQETSETDFFKVQNTVSQNNYTFFSLYKCVLTKYNVFFGQSDERKLIEIWLYGTSLSALRSGYSKCLYIQF